MGAAVDQIHALPDYAKYFILVQMVWSQEELLAVLRPHFPADRLARWFDRRQPFPITVIIWRTRPDEVEINTLRDLVNLRALATGQALLFRQR
ncbi:hypothetical protein L248_1378 [Schleiferilactobacillus shenzhenensis LY-73]|uniref:Uncharacterized protein n=2 Tax=Schleiferilactobacillus shenzhenensis TaxID=1231337 RepID=U4TN24_9LACO|nr:hypothetical protein L248_1378 [Schleiferilactobacillus shenzhenensis LY-73]